MSRIPTMLAVVALASAAVAGCATTPVPPAPPAPPPAAPAPGPPSANRVPGDVIDLTDWYLTLPTGSTDDPDDVYQPELATFSDEWFRLNDAGDGVLFTANAGGVTTEGSNYPRSELREMSGPDRADKASWTNRSGTHVMDVREAVTQLPPVKSHVVAAQIHDAEDDVIEVRLEGQHLFVEYDDGDGEVTLDPAYVLGTPYDLQIAASGSRVRVSYDGEQKADLPLSGEGWYFKAGSYVQSNPSRGEQPAAVGSVVIYTLNVEHTP